LQNKQVTIIPPAAAPQSGSKLADLPEADILITESTYGADTHPSRRSQESDLIKAIWMKRKMS
jgi:Cft2 family RNA processing exonuclease